MRQGHDGLAPGLRPLPPGAAGAGAESGHQQLDLRPGGVLGGVKSMGKPWENGGKP